MSSRLIVANLIHSKSYWKRAGSSLLHKWRKQSTLQASCHGALFAFSTATRQTSSIASTRQDQRDDITLVSDTRPADPYAPLSLLHAMSSGSLARLHSILDCSSTNKTSWKQHKSPLQSSLYPPRAYLLYLATRPPHHPSVLAYILSLYSNSNYREFDPPTYTSITEERRTFYSSSALEAAVFSNLPSMITQFLEHGWPIDAQIPSPDLDDVFTPDTFLGLAVKAGLLRMATYLLQNGADPNQGLPLNDGGLPWTLVARAAELNNVPMLQLLKKHGGHLTGNMAMYAAAGQGSIEAMNWLISQGAQAGEVVRLDGKVQLDKEFIQHGTPLHSAAWHGNMAATRYLLNKGVDKDFKTWQGETATDCAEQEGYIEIANLIKNWR